MSNNSLLKFSEAGLYRYNAGSSGTCVLADIKIGGKSKKYPLLQTNLKKYDRYQVDCAIDGTAYISGASGSITTGSVTIMDGLIIGCGDSGTKASVSSSGALKDLTDDEASLKNRRIEIDLKAGSGTRTTTVAQFSGVITGIETRTEMVQDQPAHIITLSVLGGLTSK